MGSVHATLRRAIVFQNDSSTHADRSRKLTKDLKTILGAQHVRVVDITGYTPTKIQKTIEQHADDLDATTLVGIGGGDGTASSVVRAMTTSTELTSEQRKAALLPLWGGNANDLAVMLNGLINVTSVEKILSEGSAVKIYPLRLTITPPHGDTHVYIATCYASFGATAQASWAMEHSSHIRGTAGPRNILIRVIRECIDFWRTVLELDDFRIDHGTGFERTYERIFINGSRIARIPNTAVKLTDRKYLEASAQKKNLHFILYAYNMFWRNKHGTITDKTQKFTIKDATMAQIDGEIIGLEADTAVEVSVHDTPFYALSRKLKNHR